MKSLTEEKNPSVLGMEVEISTGKNRIEVAKITGITPAMLIFSGM